MCITDYIFHVLPIKHLVNQDGEPTTAYKLTTGKKYLVSNPHVLFCLCVVWKYTAHLDTKALNMIYQSQKGFCGIFVEIPQHHKWYLVYVPSTWNFFLHMILYFIKHFLVCKHTCHIRIFRHLQSDHQSCIFCELHRLMNKLAIL